MTAMSSMSSLRHACMVTIASAVMSGCPSEDQNPAVLWLALDGSELRVRLIGEEPAPY